MTKTQCVSVNLSAKKSKEVQSESDFMSACASPSSFAIPYRFSILPTCGFAFRHVFYEL